MPEFPKHIVLEEIKGLRDMGVVVGIYYVYITQGQSLTRRLWSTEEPRGYTFTEAMQNVLVRGIPASVKRSEVGIIHRLGLRARFAVGRQNP